MVIGSSAAVCVAIKAARGYSNTHIEDHHDMPCHRDSHQRGYTLPPTNVASFSSRQTAHDFPSIQSNMMPVAAR